MNEEKTNLKKIIKYRFSYSGTKETDILYQKMILNKLDIFSKEELILLSSLINEISDTDFFNILINKFNNPPTKY